MKHNTNEYLLNAFVFIDCIQVLIHIQFFHDKIFLSKLNYELSCLIDL